MKVGEYIVQKHSSIAGWIIYRETHSVARSYGWIDEKFYVAVRGKEYLFSRQLKKLISWLDVVPAEAITECQPTGYAYRALRAATAGNLGVVLEDW